MWCPLVVSPRGLGLSGTRQGSRRCRPTPSHGARSRTGASFSPRQRPRAHHGVRARHRRRCAASPFVLQQWQRFPRRRLPSSSTHGPSRALEQRNRGGSSCLLPASPAPGAPLLLSMLTMVTALVSAMLAMLLCLLRLSPLPTPAPRVRVVMRLVRLFSMRPLQQSNKCMSRVLDVMNTLAHLVTVVSVTGLVMSVMVSRHAALLTSSPPRPTGLDNSTRIRITSKELRTNKLA